MRFDPILGAGGLATGAGSPTVCLFDPATPETCSSSVTFPGKGTFTYSSSTKLVTFVLDSSVTTQIELPAAGYKVTDSFGQSATSTLTPEIPDPPTARNDISAGYQGVAQVISPLLNDAAGSATSSLSPSTVRICANASPPTTCSGTTLSVAGEGLYVANADGTVTFIPDAAFKGVATPIAYTVTDSVGQKVTALITPTVIELPADAALPTAVTDTATGPYNKPLTLRAVSSDGAGRAPTAPAPVTTDVTASGIRTQQTITTSYTKPVLDAASVRLCAPGTGTSPAQVLPNCSATSVETVDGTYVVDTETGEVTFRPVDGFTGTVTVPVSYQISNRYTESVETETITTEEVTTDPSATCIGPDCTFTVKTTCTVSAAAVPESSTPAPASSSATPTIEPTVEPTAAPAIEPTIEPTATPTTGPTPSESAASASGAPTLAPRSGAATVAPSSGSCTPTWEVVRTTVSTVPTVKSYSATALLIPTIGDPEDPDAVDDAERTTMGTPVSVDPFDNDVAGSFDLRNSSILLCAPGETVCLRTTVRIPGQGTFSVDTATGRVTFVPLPDFVGTASVPYRILDTDGNSARATITITVDPLPDLPTDPEVPEEPVDPVRPPSSGSGGGGGGSAPPLVASPLPQLNVTAGACTDDNPCVTSPVPVRSDGEDDMVVRPHRVIMTTGMRGTPVVFDPTKGARPSEGHRLVAASVRIWNGSAWVRSFTDPGVGTWEVVGGRVRFTPAAGFTGRARADYRLRDTSGAWASATLTVLVPRSAAIVPAAGDELPRTGSMPLAIVLGIALATGATGIGLSAIGRSSGREPELKA